VRSRFDGGKESARFLMIALAEAAFEGGDIYERVARKFGYDASKERKITTPITASGV